VAVPRAEPVVGVRSPTGLSGDRRTKGHTSRAHSGEPVHSLAIGNSFGGRGAAVDRPSKKFLTGNTTLVLGLYLVAVHFIEYLMTRGLLADLPRATGRMSVTDMVRQQSAAMSVRSQAVLCVFFALATCLATGCLLLAVPAEQDLLRYVARLSGFFFTIWLGMLVAALWRRWRPSTAVSSDHDRSGRSP
jgi:hypothetical protein